MPAIEARALRQEFGSLVAVNDVSLEVAEGENLALLGPNGAGKSTLIRMFTTLLLPTSGTALVAGHDVRRDADAVRRSIGVVGTFSMGMRRRLEIARSLVHRPKVLFLDEPTTGLDPASRISMWEMLARMKAESELTIFLTTHYHGNIVAMGTSASLKALLPADETIEVSFATAPPAWAQVLEGLPGVEAAQLTNGTCRIHSRDRAGTLAALVRAAERDRVTISGLSLRGRTLEDVFIHFTGRELRDEGSEKIRFDTRLLHES